MAEETTHLSTIEKINSLTSDLKLQFELLANENQAQATELINFLHSTFTSGAQKKCTNGEGSEPAPSKDGAILDTTPSAHDTVTPRVALQPAEASHSFSNTEPHTDKEKKENAGEELKPDWLLLKQLELLKNENKALKCQLWKNNAQPNDNSQYQNGTCANPVEARSVVNDFLNDVITKAVFLAETQTSPAQLSHYLNAQKPAGRRRGRPPKKRPRLVNGSVQAPALDIKRNSRAATDTHVEELRTINAQECEWKTESVPAPQKTNDRFDLVLQNQEKPEEKLPPRRRRIATKTRVSERLLSRSVSDDDNSHEAGGLGGGETDISEPETDIPQPPTEPSWTTPPARRKRGRPRKNPLPAVLPVVRGKHRKIVRHRCQICDATFTHGRPFKRHLSSYPRGGCSCRRCKKEFISHAIFMHHNCDALRRTKGRKRHCRHCGMKFTNTKKYSAHLKQEHNDKAGEPYCFCKYCNKGFIKRATMFKHYLEHAEPGQTACWRCGEMIGDTDEAREQHHRYHTEKAKHECPKCGAMFIRRQQYEQHLAAHSKYDCPMCDARFSTRKAQEKHQRLIHGIRTDYDTKKFYCDQCGKCFVRPGLLEIHTRIHTGEKPIECTVCHMYFRTPKALNKHKQTYTHMARSGDIQKERDHLCQVCGKAYYRKQALQRHMRYHTGEKPYKCPHCDYVCRENNNLKRHIALHFSRRDFVCETCGAAFHAKKTLETHRVYKHSETRSYHCEECPMSFKTPNSLRRHMRIHSNTRPHKCTWCGTGFNRLYNLRRHLRSVHGNDEGLPPPKRVKLLDVPTGLEYHKGSVAAATGMSPPEPSASSKKKARRDKGHPSQPFPEIDVKEQAELLSNAAIFSGIEDTGVRQEGMAILISPPVAGKIPGEQETLTLQSPAAASLNTQVINQIVSNTVSLMHGYYQDADGNVRGYTLAPPVGEVSNRGLAVALPQENNVQQQPQQQTVHITDRTDFSQEIYNAMPNFLHYMQGNT